ncbi:acetyl-CoA hydrolase/transferase C-terminal domain-containing protein [Afipia sp. 1NLS2]|uniref:acetyl-CoA hydrolase/transferase C-terminal domain-containing protein n=1 Tax=Afipia sp. 1NLS2 TaxID=666684 RepID=UPI0001D9E62D|nr:acetyl-CoA hydrolase/transferase C-terminal domain-containing protein [Afipia sp. 1NLS2]EFI51503.1 acetyl-CoA hydrolase/transferase family protein [Afipia sp. 1NLS2]
MSRIYADAHTLVDAVLRECGPRLVVGLPLGLGKANHIANALCERAAADSAIHLTIFTALTLEKPTPKSDLERRFIGPVIERLFGGYPDLDYAKWLHAGILPENIEITEFFFLAGKWLHNGYAQQHYIAANYTHAVAGMLTRGLNVVLQLVAKRVVNGEVRYSLSCNTDTTLDLLKARAEGKIDFKLIGQVNSELPFMPGPGDLPASEFHAILDSAETDFPLFAPPSEPVGDAKYAIGLHAATLIEDGGTLQIGIGQVGDALAQCLIVRDRNNVDFCTAVSSFSPGEPARVLAPFKEGLNGLSEMFFEAFLGLIEAGIVRREVDGAWLHAAFFLGPKSFYRALREMPQDRLNRIQMMPVSFTNELYGDEDAKRIGRPKARFVNNAMMVTLLGDAISDGLSNGQMVSGVGGQYNFVAQSFALDGARSILTLEATRHNGKRLESNIRWSYDHTTIPRHLRDIVVTEYGIADLRGKSDAEVIAAMLCVSDSRFQDELMRQAKAAGKLPLGYEIPSAYRTNTPERIARALAPLREKGLLPEFPFGTDFTATEQRLIPALQSLQQASSSPAALLSLLWRGLSASSTEDADCLARMGLDAPATMREHLYCWLLRGALRR